MDAVSPDRPLVQLSTGAVAGHRSDGVDRYLGIPYARPPIGDLRLAAPNPVDPWPGVRDASRFGATAPQLPYPGAIGRILTSVEIAGDDVLTVNVWAPAGATAAPVVVWIHGGAFERGTPALSMYDGATFARDGVVFVSVGYRLGAEGFAVLDGAPHNRGLRDVALALEWVAREVSAFGGDPGRVTVMGESAGGALVAALVARPDSAALIRGAVVQSGPLVAESAARAARSTRALAARLRIPATRAAFSEIPVDELVRVRGESAAGSTPLRGAAGFSLVIDGDSLPESPHTALQRSPVPLLIGTNTEEYRLWFPPAALARIGRLHLAVARRAVGVGRRGVAAFRRAWPTASTGELFGQIATDLMLRAPAVRAARSRDAATWVYEFAWPSGVPGLGAAHAVEIPFVFDHVDDEDAERLIGRDAPAELASRMHADWVSFIRDGAPGWEPFAAAATVRRYAATIVDTVLPRAELVDAIPPARVR